MLRKVAGIVNDGYHANGHAHTRRKQDTFGRYGGEEFVFVLPNTPLRNAAAYCEKVRRIVEGAVFENSFGERFGVTISIGVAEITRLEAQLAGEEGLENLIKSAVGEADARMYAAKR